MGGKMSAEGIFYGFIYVRDLKRSIKFYGQTLGWKIGTHEKDVAGFAFGTGYIIVHADTRPRAQRKYGGGMWLAVKVSDVNAEHKRLKKKKVKVGELLDQHWGERQFYFDDPDGYHWSFGQHMGK
jgi:catechol 2,3-dioxygenase-like lactoylglutathione lyase family enzyme